MPVRASEGESALRQRQLAETQVRELLDPSQRIPTPKATILSKSLLAGMGADRVRS